MPIIDVTGKPPVHMQTMKTQTKIDRIAQFTQLQELRGCRDRAKTRLLAGIDTLNPWETKGTHTALDEYAGRLGACIEAEEKWKERDRKSRIWAQQHVNRMQTTVLEQIKRDPALERSGKVEFVVEWTTSATPHAQTLSSSGEQYSRRCKYRKTDATHIVRLSPEWATGWTQADATASSREGIVLIGLKSDGQACWLTVKNRGIHLTQGWFVADRAISDWSISDEPISGEGLGLGYHSTKSLEHAQKGLAKKVAARRRELDSIRAQYEAARKGAEERNRSERRVRLLARRCNLRATIADAKELGFCDVGIQQFQNRFGISDSATLPELVKTGDPSATRLAFHIARKAIAASAR